MDLGRVEPTFLPWLRLGPAAHIDSMAGSRAWTRLPHVFC